MFLAATRTLKRVAGLNGCCDTVAHDRLYLIGEAMPETSHISVLQSVIHDKEREEWCEWCLGQATQSLMHDTGKLVHRCGHAVDVREVKSSIKQQNPSIQIAKLLWLRVHWKIHSSCSGRTRTLGEAFDPRRALVMARPPGPSGWLQPKVAGFSWSSLIFKKEVISVSILKYHEISSNFDRTKFVANRKTSGLWCVSIGVWWCVGVSWCMFTRILFSSPISATPRWKASALSPWHNNAVAAAVRSRPVASTWTLLSVLS